MRLDGVSFLVVEVVMRQERLRFRHALAHRDEVFVRVGRYGPYIEQGERKSKSVKC
jgi:hypothetical protein